MKRSGRARSARFHFVSLATIGFEGAGAMIAEETLDTDGGVRVLVNQDIRKVPERESAEGWDFGRDLDKFWLVELKILSSRDVV
jgi:hypothetical protein